MPLPLFAAALLKIGAPLLANAALAKGKEWVEEKTGVKLDSPDLTPEAAGSGGLETTGYVASSCELSASPAVVSSTAGFIVGQTAAANLFSGHMILTRTGTLDEWISSHFSTTVVVTGVGSKVLSATLDRISITTVGGTAAFDGGTATVLYE